MGTPLVGGHWAPEFAVPLNEYGGAEVFTYGKQNPRGALTGTWNKAVNRDGMYHSHTATSARVNWPTDSLMIPVDTGGIKAQVTVLLGMKKQDTTNRASTAFGVTDSIDNGDRCGAHCPYSDGTVYWDFGSVASGRLTAAGLTVSGDNVWAFTSGRRGQEIWQNGQLKASSANDNGRVAGVTPGFNLGFGNGLTGSCSDLADFNFIYVFWTQLPAAMIQELSLLPFTVFEPYRTRIYGAPKQITAAITLSTTMDTASTRTAQRLASFTAAMTAGVSTAAQRARKASLPLAMQAAIAVAPLRARTAALPIGVAVSVRPAPMAALHTAITIGAAAGVAVVNTLSGIHPEVFRPASEIGDPGRFRPSTETGTPGIFKPVVDIGTPGRFKPTS
jgi:hypothetical protein